MNDKENYNKPIDEVEMDAILKEQEKIWRKQQIAELAEKLFVANSSRDVVSYDAMQNMAHNAFFDAKIFIEAKEQFLASKEGDK